MSEMVEAMVGIEIEDDNLGFEERREAVAEELEIDEDHVAAVSEVTFDE